MRERCEVAQLSDTEWDVLDHKILPLARARVVQHVENRISPIRANWLVISGVNADNDESISAVRMHPSEGTTDFYIVLAKRCIEVVSISGDLPPVELNSEEVDPEEGCEPSEVIQAIQDQIDFGMTTPSGNDLAPLQTLIAELTD